MQVCTTVHTEQAVGFCSSSWVYNSVTNRRTNNSNVTFCDVNRCSLLVDTRSNQYNTTITIGRVTVNCINCSFNSLLRVANTVTFVAIKTVNRVNVNDLIKLSKCTARRYSVPAGAVPHVNSLVIIILIPSLTGFPVRTRRSALLNKGVKTTGCSKSCKDIGIGFTSTRVLLCFSNNVVIFNLTEINGVISKTKGNSTVTVISYSNTGTICTDVTCNSCVNFTINAVINSFTRCNLGVIADPSITIIQRIVVTIPVVILQILINVIRNTLAVSLLNSVTKLLKVFVKVIRPNGRARVEQRPDVVHLGDTTDLNVVNRRLTWVNWGGRCWRSSTGKLYNSRVSISNTPGVGGISRELLVVFFSCSVPEINVDLRFKNVRKVKRKS